MRDGPDGGYRPHVDAALCTECMLCQAVCPFHEEVDGSRERYEAWFPDANEFNALLGRYITSFLGHNASLPDRLASTSGGLLSWLLAELLRSGRVDAVYCTIPTGCSDPLYAFHRFEAPEDVLRSRGSAYYPTHVAQVLEEIRQRPGRYAVTALPCAARGIRRAMERFGVLRERIHFVLGLVCGIVMSKSFSRYLAAVNGVHPDSIHRITYRISEEGTAANRFVFRMQYHDSSGNPATCDGRLVRLGDEAAALEACRYCIEPFPLAADAAFMDAWISPYREQYEGTSIALVRNPTLVEVLEKGRDSGALVLREASEAEVIESQRSAAIRKKLVRNPLRTGVELPASWQRVASELYPRMTCLERCIEKVVARRTKKATRLLPMELKEIDRHTFGYRVVLSLLRRIERVINIVKG